MKPVGILGALALVALLVIERGRQRWLSSCMDATKAEDPVFWSACAETAANMSWTEALRIGLGGKP